MKETYHLNEKILPTIPVPHDCTIEEIRLEGQELVFVFEDDIAAHDAVKSVRPSAKSLMIRYHLMGKNEFSVYQRNTPGRLFRKKDVYKRLDHKVLFNLTHGKKNDSHLDYLYHNIGYCSIIIQLCTDRATVVIEACVDYLEYEWIE